MWYCYNSGYRHPRTTQERRENGSRKDHELKQWRRAKRSACNIPNSYDDIPNDKYKSHKTWKNKRKNQYRVGQRPEPTTLYIENVSGVSWEYSAWRKVWNLTEYLREQDIPHRIEEDKTIERTTQVVTTERVYSHCEVFFPDGSRRDWPLHVWIDVTIKPVIVKRKWKVTHGYKVTIWTNKNLDLTSFGFGV